MKRFFALIMAALLFSMAPASAETQQDGSSDIAASSLNDSIEKFYTRLPKAKSEYKSRVRPILIEGAMNTETETLIRALKNPVAYRDLNYLFVAGTYKDYPVVIARTEIGLANAAASTALAIKKFNPIAVINQGTAGGHDAALKIGDIVIGERSIDFFAIKTAYSAAGAGSDITNQKMLGTYAYNSAGDKFESYEEFFPDQTLLKVAKKVANNHKEFKAVLGTISTSNAWLNNVDYIKFLHETYGSSCEEMETNSVAQICQSAGVPFIGIRVLSDNIIHNSDYVPESAVVCQKFILLVVEDYIRDVLRK